MTITVKDISREMEKLAPIFLKEDFDNVGLMVGSKDKEVKKVLLALDCTKDVIEEGKREGVDLIITHHPLIFRKPSRIVNDDLQGWKIIELIKNDISLYSSHTNLDSTKDGINEEIVKVLGFSQGKLIESSKVRGFEECGLGRVVYLDSEIELNNLINIVKEKLGISSLRVVVGKENVKNIAIINGSGQDFFGKAIGMGADCIITGDTSYHFASDYKEMGINILDVGHFASEQVTFFNVMERLKEKFSDVEFITSKVEEDPFSFY